MTEKPSQNEDEYFARRDAELMKEQREKAAREEEQARRKQHFMKCPKCGGDLEPEEYQGIEVDRCADCSGVWFDAGEAESLLEREEGAGESIFRSILRGVRGRQS